MATITHLAAGAVCGAVYARKTSTSPAVAIPAFAALAASPDLDFLGLAWGDTRGTPIEHRVLTHSLVFAAIVGVPLGSSLARRGRRKLAAILAVVALASHGFIDAFTSSGKGPELLWPFVSARMSFPWTPIPGTEYFQEYFTLRGLGVIAHEALFCIPFLVATAWILWSPARSRRAGRMGGRDELAPASATASND